MKGELVKTTWENNTYKLLGTERAKRINHVTIKGNIGEDEDEV